MHWYSAAKERSPGPWARISVSHIYTIQLTRRHLHTRRDNCQPARMWRRAKAPRDFEGSIDDAERFHQVMPVWPAAAPGVVFELCAHAHRAVPTALYVIYLGGACRQTFVLHLR